MLPLHLFIDFVDGQYLAKGNEFNLSWIVNIISRTSIAGNRLMI
jgi:hypothetical protein